MKMTTISGTREWAKKNVNCCTGCSHDCRYCYAREQATRYGRVSAENWHQEQIRPHDVTKKFQKVQGTPPGGMDVMFPTTHDITPAILMPCTQVLGNILQPGNSVLVVSKPHLSCIAHLCHAFAMHNKTGTNQLMFRFTIGAMDDELLRYWDRNAPLWQERLDSLKLAYHAGFRTSVSGEPMLDTAHVVEWFHALKPYCTESIWIGKMNKIAQRIPVKTAEDALMVERIVAGQTDERVREVYRLLKDESLVRWKESYKSVLGLALTTEAGADV
jgi:hypothetical protein